MVGINLNLKLPLLSWERKYAKSCMFAQSLDSFHTNYQ